MKRALALLVGGVLVLGSVLTAYAQAPTVSFGGQMRVYGFAVNNITDFKDSDNGNNRDSGSYYFQRFRLFTTIESADKKAKAYWALEIGDMTWGNGGGANADSTVGCNGQLSGVPGQTGSVTDSTGTAVLLGPDGKPAVVKTTPNAVSSGTRVGNGSGNCLGADGVNVETKNIYLWMDTGEWAPGTSVLLGIHNIVFLNGPLGAFADDDAAGIQLNWKGEPADVQVWAAKLGEGNVNNADDTDAYAVRIGVNVTKDLRLTLEGLVVDERSMAGQSFGDTFWIGATVAAKLGDIMIDGSFLYGQRAYQAAVVSNCGNATNPCQESGFGAYVLVRAPVGPANVNGLVWYTSGDSTRAPGAGASSVSTKLTQDSDKLPMPWIGGGWFNGGGAYMGEWILGLSTIGNPGPPSVLTGTFGDPTGTYGFGASATFNVTPAFQVGGGVAYIGATDSAGIWGDNVIEVDAGVSYRFNPNVTLNLIGGYMFPDQGDAAYGLAFRTVFGF